ncbi:AP-5 complex subunit beta-1 [Tanacetum coccineum]
MKTAPQLLCPSSVAEKTTALAGIHRICSALAEPTPVELSQRRIHRRLVTMTLESRGLIPVIVSFVNRLLKCHKHRFFGVRLLQTFSNHLLPKVDIDYRLGSYFPLFEKIAENEMVPPAGADLAYKQIRHWPSVPGNKLRQLLSTGDQLPSSHSSSFFSVQSPRYSYDSKKSKDISSYIHLERVAPLLVRHSWSLSFTSFDINGDSSRRMEVIKDNNTPLGCWNLTIKLTNLTLTSTQRIDQV